MTTTCVVFHTCSGTRLRGAERVHDGRFVSKRVNALVQWTKQQQDLQWNERLAQIHSYLPDLFCQALFTTGGKFDEAIIQDYLWSLAMNH